MTNTKKIHKAVLTIEVEVIVDEHENWSLDEIDHMIGDALESGSIAMRREVEFDFSTCSITYDE
jgi:hypothetical protein